MRIGIDFDNTIVNYNKIFVEAAKNKKFIAFPEANGSEGFKVVLRPLQAVRYSNFGNSESITKLYAISDNKQTMVIVNLASNSFGSTQTTDQQTIRIKIIGKITLKM